MKALIIAAVLAGIISSPALAQYGSNRGSSHGNSGYGGYGYGTGSSSQSHQNSGYYNSRGTYVQPHRQTNPNGTQYDNYNSRGNYNPYSGRYGTRTPKY
jgi:hypothetical protein